MDGFSQALLDDYGNKLDEQAKDFLGRIRTACQRMSQLIDDLLNLSHVSRAVMQSESVNLSALVQSLADQLRLEQPERMVEFVIAPDVRAMGDGRLLTIALENLLRNAWKFTSRAPHPVIEFGVLQREDRPLYFVRDNGAGFDMMYADKLFKPFQRLHTTSEFAGTGIGLAIVQRIVRRHGGTVSAEGQPEKGATFFFTL
jgi:light-regulated signal transduction histidine kinase (bacteriophytochrome)